MFLVVFFSDFTDAPIGNIGERTRTALKQILHIWVWVQSMIVPVGVHLLVAYTRFSVHTLGANFVI